MTVSKKMLRSSLDRPPPCDQKEGQDLGVEQLPQHPNSVEEDVQTPVVRIDRSYHMLSILRLG